MSDNLTFKNHYIPCFWSAFWNEEYINNCRNDFLNKTRPREVKLLACFIEEKKRSIPKNCKFFQKRAEDLFYHKGAYLAWIENQKEINFLTSAFPNLKKDFGEFNDQELYIFDYEQKFTSIENIYRESLISVIRRKRILDEEERVYLAFFIYTQILRNPYYFNFFEDYLNSNDLSKIVLFTEMDKSLCDQSFLLDRLQYFLKYRWNIYVTSDNPFPLSDFPFAMIGPRFIFCLAPDMLLEIDLKDTNPSFSNYLILNDSKKREITESLWRGSIRHIVFTQKGYESFCIQNK